MMQLVRPAVALVLELACRSARDSSRSASSSSPAAAAMRAASVCSFMARATATATLSPAPPSQAARTSPRATASRHPRPRRRCRRERTREVDEAVAGDHDPCAVGELRRSALEQELDRLARHRVADEPMHAAAPAARRPRRSTSVDGGVAERRPLQAAAGDQRDDERGPAVGVLGRRGAGDVEDGLARRGGTGRRARRRTRPPAAGRRRARRRTVVMAASVAAQPLCPSATASSVARGPTTATAASSLGSV